MTAGGVEVELAMHVGHPPGLLHPSIHVWCRLVPTSGLFLLDLDLAMK